MISVNKEIQKNKVLMRKGLNRKTFSFYSNLSLSD